MEQGQNWEDLAHAVDDRYARCGGLAELVDELDATFDTASANDTRRIEALDNYVKGQLKEAWEAAAGLFEKALLGGLAIAVWDGNRRRHGEAAIPIGRASDGSRPPFGSMAAAWAFAEEARGVAIGAGPISTVVAETSELALARGRAAERAGRDRGDAGGFIPMEWMASSPTHVGGSSAKNETRVILRDDVLMALERSVEDADVPLLFLVVLGEQQRVPAKRALGDKSDDRARPQFERVRLTYKEAARRSKERGDTDSEEAICQRIKRARSAFRSALEVRKLIPTMPVRAPRAEREAARRPTNRFEMLDDAERAAGR